MPVKIKEDIATLKTQVYFYAQGGQGVLLGNACHKLRCRYGLNMPTAWPCLDSCQRSLTNSFQCGMKTTWQGKRNMDSNETAKTYHTRQTGDKIRRDNAQFNCPAQGHGLLLWCFRCCHLSKTRTQKIQGTGVFWVWRSLANWGGQRLIKLTKIVDSRERVLKMGAFFLWLRGTKIKTPSCLMLSRGRFAYQKPLATEKPLVLELQSFLQQADNFSHLI